MNTQMNLQRVAIERLKPAKYNPRKDLKPGDPAYEKIRRSLHDFGYVDPVIWNDVTGNIVGGHPVSYTHLDVYKRQFQSHARRGSGDGDCAHPDRRAGKAIPAVPG